MSHPDTKSPWPPFFLVYGVTQPDIIGMATHGLREGPLQTIRIVVALGAAHAGIAVSRTVVGHGSFGEVVPPFAGWAVCEERVRVGEKRRVGKGSLEWLLVQYSTICSIRRQHTRLYGRVRSHFHSFSICSGDSWCRDNSGTHQRSR